MQAMYVYRISFCIEKGVHLDLALRSPIQGIRDFLFEPQAYASFRIFNHSNFPRK